MSKNVEKNKPTKPHPDFPLYAHSSGRWAKKVRGKTEYFGPWGDPNGALEEWLRSKDWLLAGRRPPELSDSVTIKIVCDEFYGAKKRLVAIDQLAPRTLSDYFKTCKRLTRVFGRLCLAETLQPIDFANLRDDMAKSLGPVAMRNEMTRVRTIMKFARSTGMIKEPVDFGDEFKKPPKRSVRIAKRKRNKKMFDQDDIKAILENAGVQMKAMVLLGINGGFGNKDCGTLPIQSVDFDSGWIDWYRPKTGIMRRFPLWNETKEALQAVLEARKPQRMPNTKT